MFELTRTSPATHSPIRRLFDSIATDPFFNGPNGDGDDAPLALDVSEKDDTTIVRASLPGFRKEDVDIQFHDGILTLRATHNDEETFEGETFHRRERRMRSLERAIRLPNVDHDANIEADLANGVLTVRLPHSEASRPRKINVN